VARCRVAVPGRDGVETALDLEDEELLLRETVRELREVALVAVPSLEHSSLVGIVQRSAIPRSEKASSLSSAGNECFAYRPSRWRSSRFGEAIRNA
jgi:hypothetical protein